ncbi:MAG: ATP-binding protein, partial [Candidatus Eisenbacteria bacterium]
MDANRFEALLHEDEGSALDFKRDQYRFEGESDEVKGELLKDVLAFANSWQRTQAYILIGVEEVRGGRSRVVGVEGHLNDHDLQQFISSKTQRPVEFSYIVWEHEGLSVGILHIPVQERPLYLKQDYGRLKRDTVYMRRGSSTVEASPDEVARMGKADGFTPRAPELHVELGDGDDRAVLGTRITLNPLLLSVPGDAEIPDYDGPGPHPTGLFENKEFYRELAVYARDFYRVQPVRFAVTNRG